MNENENETRTCSDCGTEFAFGAEERRFFEERGLTPPKRCRACRKARKAERGFGAPNDRPSFDRGGGDRGGGDRGGGDRGGGDRGARFGDRGGDRGRPSEGRPSGWGARRDEGFRGPSTYGGGGGGGGGDRPRFSPRPDDRRPRDSSAPNRGAAPKNAAPPAPRPRKERPKYDITCQRCGAAAQVPFKPVEGRALFCKPCYDARKAEQQAAGAAPVGEVPATPEE